MWIYLSDAMLSIVQDLNDKSAFLVRARVSGDIKRHFPNANVRVGEGTDYAFRASVPKMEVSNVLSKYLAGLTYPNFKQSVTGKTVT